MVADTTLKDHSTREIARPNNETLYISAFFDVFGNNLHDVMQFVFNQTTCGPEDQLDQRVPAVHEPLAVVVSKTLILKGRPWKFQVQH